MFFLSSQVKLNEVQQKKDNVQWKTEECEGGGEESNRKEK